MIAKSNEIKKPLDDWGINQDMLWQETTIYIEDNEFAVSGGKHWY